MTNTLQRAERILLSLVLAIGALLLIGYVVINLYSVRHPPTEKAPLFGAISVSEVRAQLGQLGDFLNPILTGVSLTFLALSYRSQQREWRVARMFAMASDYNEAVEQIRARDSAHLGRALLYQWVVQVVEGLDVEPTRFAGITDAQLRALADLLERRRPLFHRSYRLLVQLAGVAGSGPADQDDATAAVITTMTHQELLLMTMLATLGGHDSGALAPMLHAQLASLGFAALSARIRAVCQGTTE